ncbi:MAG TPA: hypothetical protein VJY33_09285, partial [Isosphaeraceae bacterium]|nr:hypothetical protein [Isosphaeraceae bacterium]
EFGWNAFAQELKQLLATPLNISGRQEILVRNVEWLSAFCCVKTANPERLQLAHELCSIAVERFCEPRPPRPAYYPSHHHRESSISETSLPLLIKALAASGRDQELARVIRFVLESPDDFSLDDCQVPCLKSLIPWSQKEFGSVHPQLVSWLACVRQQLESATAEQPVPPSDWARPAKVPCDCRYCAQLKAFLADPTNELIHIPAREDTRHHLISIIHSQECDVKFTTTRNTARNAKIPGQKARILSCVSGRCKFTVERKGSPYSLVLTKTNGSFERSVQRFEANRKLLSSLPPSP